MLSRVGRDAQCDHFAAKVEPLARGLRPPRPPADRTFGPAPNGYIRDFGFWQPGFSAPEY